MCVNRVPDCDCTNVELVDKIDENGIDKLESVETLERVDKAEPTNIEKRLETGEKSNKPDRSYVSPFWKANKIRFNNPPAQREICMKVSNSNAVAGCLPNIQGVAVDCLWDTGATISLIKNAVAETLLKNGAQRELLKRQTKISGIGKDTIVAKERVRANVRFQDGVEREIFALMVSELPHEMIIGVDFMRQHSVSFTPLRTGFKLTSADGAEVHNSSVETEIAPVNPVLTFRGQKKVGKKGLRKYLERWERLPEADKQLLHDLVSTRFVPMDEHELEKRMAKTGLKQSQEQVAVTGDLASAVPACDFPAYQERLNKLVEKYSDVFSTDGSDVGRANGRRVAIRLCKEDVVNERNYRTPLKLRHVLRELLDELLKAGVIEKCATTEWNSPCLLVPKKTEGTVTPLSAAHRLVVDYRKLNNIIENVVYPMPRISDIISDYHGCSCFSNVDIRHAYYTIELEQSSRQYTAFSCEFGKYQFKFLPQGLKVSPAIFQDQISNDLRGLTGTNPYMDDIITGSDGPENELLRLERLFERLQLCGYKLKLSKCHFMKNGVTFAGHDVTGNGIAVSTEKIDAAQRLKRPVTLSQVKSLLGFTSFLRQHIPYYCDMLGPIQRLLSIDGLTKNAEITHLWDDKCESAFTMVKETLQNPDVLAYPDGSRPFVLYTDASKYAMSGVLLQHGVGENESKLYPIGYWSKAFKGSQLNWAALVKEARAVYEAVQHFAVYLKGCKVLLKCDHKPLARFLSHNTKNEMVNRWSLSLQEFDIEFEWVDTEANISDCLSRLGDLGLYHKLERETDFPERPKQRTQLPLQDIAIQAEPEKTDSELQTVVQVARLKHKKGEPRRVLTETEELQLFGLSPSTKTIDMTRLSDEQVKQLQRSDNFCKRIIERMNDFGEENGTFTLRENGLLYRMYWKTTEGKQTLPGWALVIPKCLRLTVMMRMHRELEHAGRDKTLAAMRSRVYWKGMDKQVSEFIQGCRICRFRLLKEQIHRQIRIPPPRGPGLRLAIDLWSAEGHTCLTAIDLHSQYPFAIEVPDKKAFSVVKAMQVILGQMRDPREIYSDNGSEFTSWQFKKLMYSRGISHDHTAPNVPNWNGILERWHRYLNAVVRTTLNLSDESDFAGAVRAALETYRRMPHSSSGESPLFLFTGQEPSYSIDHLLPTLSREVVDPNTGNIDLSQLHTAYALARKNIVLARLKNASKKPLKVYERPIVKDDLVFIRNFDHPTKTDPRWISGFRVLDVIDNEIIVRDTDSGKRKRVARRHCRLSDPVGELIGNSNIDVFPGTSKLYLSADDLQDLNWEAVDDIHRCYGFPQWEREIDDKAKEIVRNRANDLHPQPEPKRTRTDINDYWIDPEDDPTLDPGGVSLGEGEGDKVVDVDPRPKRLRRRNVRLKDYVCHCAVNHTIGFGINEVVKVVHLCQHEQLADQ